MRLSPARQSRLLDLMALALAPWAVLALIARALGVFP
jgi:hypothetical protein